MEEQDVKGAKQEASSAVVEAQDNQDPIKPPKASWFTPLRLLVIFCIMNMLNYIDRGVIASNGVNGTPRKCTSDGLCTPGTGIQGAFNLNNFQVGVLSSAFMVGLLVASPIFASLTKCINPFRLIGFGLIIWTLATAGCGASFNFWTIAVCRMLVGVGEASFINLAAPYIDDNAPASKKSAWLAAFYMCIPTGIAVGYIYGGWIGGSYSWRYAFFGESILMVPFVILGFIIKPLRLKGFAHPKPDEELISEERVAPEVKDMQMSEVKAGPFGGKEAHNDSNPKLEGEVERRSLFSRFLKDVKELLDKVYVVNVLGYILYNFVVGSYSYWGPKAGSAIYHMRDPDMWFGGITVVCGILGTLAGGFFLDWMNSTIRNAFKFLSSATLLGAIFCFGAFCLRNMYGFMALFSVGELLVFATQAPVNYVCLHCVKPSLRPLSIALATVSIHIFGDVPSSPLVGLVQDRINNWRMTALLLTSILFFSSAVWFIGIFLHSVDKSNEDEHEISADEHQS